MEKYKYRLVVEENELDDKINKLIDFIDSNKFWELSFIKRWKLRRQLNLMVKYDNILMDRISIEKISEEDKDFVKINESTKADSIKTAMSSYPELKEEISDLKILINKKDNIIIEQNQTISKLKKDIELYELTVKQLSEKKRPVKEETKATISKPKKTKKNVENKEN